MNNVTLFLIPYEYGNYVRTHGQSIIAVQAKVGRKHMTVIDAYKGALIDRIKFDLVGDIDENGAVFHDQVSDYTSDFYAYEKLEDAEAYLRRNVLLKEIKQYVFDKLPLDVLQSIADVLYTHSEQAKKSFYERRTK